MLAYIPYMDPMGYDNDDPMIHEYRPTARCDTRLVERRGLRGPVVGGGKLGVFLSLNYLVSNWSVE